MLQEIWSYIVYLLHTEVFGTAFSALATLLVLWAALSFVQWLGYFTGLFDYLRRFK